MAGGHQCHVCASEDPEGVRKPRPVVNVRKPLWCATHRRIELRRQGKVRHAAHVERTYDINASDAHELLLFQGGRCWLCKKATGATKSLAVDHDHRTNEVRGRLCGPCNQFIGKIGDDPEAARRLVAYLTGDTPYRRMKAQQTLQQLFGDDIHVEKVAPLSSAERSVMWYRESSPAVQHRSTMVLDDHGGWEVLSV